jgi:hypothetical protein
LSEFLQIQPHYALRKGSKKTVMAGLISANDAKGV